MHKHRVLRPNFSTISTHIRAEFRNIVAVIGRRSVREQESNVTRCTTCVCTHVVHTYRENYKWPRDGPANNEPQSLHYATSIEPPLAIHESALLFPFSACPFVFMTGTGVNRLLIPQSWADISQRFQLGKWKIISLVSIVGKEQFAYFNVRRLSS